ncbi:DMT family transporter [Fusibacter bizertensis]
MASFIIYIFAIILGILVTVVPIINGENTKTLGTFRVSMFHYLSALVVGMIFFLIFNSSTQPYQIGTIPLHYYLGGILGLSVILLMNYYSSRIIALHISILPFLGQMTMGLIIDYFLFKQLNYKTIIGLSIVLVGLYIQSSPKRLKSIKS